jgi:predicted transcriptional regulator
MKTENRVKKIESILSQLELSTSEVHIYTTLLRRGPSSIAEIAKAVNMSRVNVHYLVENMLTLGILHETQQPRRRLIFVHKRAAVEALIEKKKEKMDLLAQEASTLQTFFDLINTSKKTHVRDYE